MRVTIFITGLDIPVLSGPQLLEDRIRSPRGLGRAEESCVGTGYLGATWGSCSPTLGKVVNMSMTRIASPGWDSNAGLLFFFFWKLLPLSLFHCLHLSLSSSRPLPFFLVSPFLQELP